ncbi:winged helix-turn-helix domain-containing protein, partial [Serratia marcescens]
MRHTLITLFQQSPQAVGTLRERLCAALRQAIHHGTLNIGQRLPSSRVLAGDLKLSRVTVEAAYGQLEAEGYLQRRVGQGTFVAIRIAKSLPPPPRTAMPRLSQRGQQIVQTGG